MISHVRIEVGTTSSSVADSIVSYINSSKAGKTLNSRIGDGVVFKINPLEGPNQLHNYYVVSCEMYFPDPNSTDAASVLTFLRNNVNEAGVLSLLNYAYVEYHECTHDDPVVLPCMVTKEVFK